MNEWRQAGNYSVDSRLGLVQRLSPPRAREHPKARPPACF